MIAHAAAVREAIPGKYLDLPAGDAVTTLQSFSRQSGEEIIFPIEQVRTIRTNAVRGALSPREALDRMLAGTGLVAVRDEPTGALAVRAASVQSRAPATIRTASPPAEDRTVMLPPIFVESTRVTPLRWRYFKIRDLEFLSCCDDATTTQLIERTYHLHQRLEGFLPADFRVRLAAPTTFVLYGELQHPVDFKEIIADMQSPGLAASDDRPGSAEALTVRYLPNFRFAERDELAAFYILKEQRSGAGSIKLNSAFVRSLMEHRTPPLPRWFIDGMMALYQDSALEVEPINSGGLATTSPEELTATKFPYGSALIRLPRWMFGTETMKLANSAPPVKPALRPMAEIFATPPPPGGAALPGTEPRRSGGPGDAEQRYVGWWSQSALFIHWALNNDDGRSRDALWKLVKRASVEPVTEAMFAGYFGQNYEKMNETLAGYWPNAVRTNVRMYAEDFPEMPLVSLRNASGTEISRIKGNLERLELAYVKRKYPALAPRYLTLARRTLRQAYDKGSREPGLLEVMGLCECDAGNDAAAQPYLVAAVQGGAIRPRAGYELARIKFQALCNPVASAPLNAAQTAELLELLFAARAQSPPLPEVYELIAAVWRHSSVAPQRGNLAVLHEGIRYFPGNLELIYSTAALAVARGFGDEAGALIKLGLQAAPTDFERSRFQQLQPDSPAPVAD